MAGPHLAFVKIIVGDLTRAERFYGDAFGLQRTGSFATDAVEEVILRGAGGASLVLYGWKDGRALIPGTTHGPIGFYVEDVDDAYAHALRAGAAHVREPADYGSIRAAFVVSPDGHEIELVAR